MEALMKEYLPRVSDNVLKDHLDSKGAVLIEGANGVERLQQQSILRLVL